VARARATYLSEREKDLLHEKTLEVFEKVGVAYKTPQAIDLLASAGAEVDRDALTAKLTWDIIEPCLKTAPKKVLLAGRRPEDDRALGEWPLHTTTDGIQTYVYDDLTGRRREGTAADLETFVTTGPMSVLGTSILNMAELLSAVVPFQLAAPECAMVSAVGSAVAEMRSGLYLSGTPEDGLINLTCIEMSKVYGLRSQGSAVSCDAKACDLQAGGQGMHTGLATALAGADVRLAFGLMDSAQTASLAKTVLDADTVNAIERFLRDDPIDEARARRRHRRGRDRRALPHAQEHEAVLSCRRALAAAALAPGVVRTLRRHSAGEGRLGAGPRADREERRAAAARRRPAARRLADRRLPAEPRVSRPGRTDAAGATPSGGGRAG
jgi:trimethylamine:corrinoid methyltransferase-like protein